MQGEVSGSTMTAEVIDHVIYTAFGAPSQGASYTSQPLPRFGFDGMRYDAATGFDLTATRPYDPNTGTWIQPDPIGFLGGRDNLSEFVGNDPANFVDASGLAVIPPSQQYPPDPSGVPVGMMYVFPGFGEYSSGGGYVPIFGCDCCAGGGFDNPSIATSLGGAAGGGDFGGVQGGLGGGGAFGGGAVASGGGGAFGGGGAASGGPFGGGARFGSGGSAGGSSFGGGGPSPFVHTGGWNGSPDGGSSGGGGSSGSGFMNQGSHFNNQGSSLMNQGSYFNNQVSSFFNRGGPFPTPLRPASPPKKGKEGKEGKGKEERAIGPSVNFDSNPNGPFFSISGCWINPEGALPYPFGNVYIGGNYNYTSPPLFSAPLFRIRQTGRRCIRAARFSVRLRTRTIHPTSNIISTFHGTCKTTPTRDRVLTSPSNGALALALYDA